MTSSWDTFDCPATIRRWRVDVDGRIEIEGLGKPDVAWPKDVNQWAPIIAAKSKKYGIPATWIAAIMALESRGVPGQCARKKDGSCHLGEGIGLMAMLKSTASWIAGKEVSVQELLDDHDLQIDLGAKLIAHLAEKYNGDYVSIGIAYNAGRVRCASGTSGRTWPPDAPDSEPCPPTPWGVIMGCVRTGRKVNPLCAPSTVKPKMYVCPTNYPEVAIRTHNAAIGSGWTEAGLGVEPPPEPGNGKPPPPPFPETPPARAGIGAHQVVPFAAAAVLGYFGFTFLYGGMKKRRRYR